MNRRELMGNLAGLATGVGTLAPTALLAQASKPEAGVDYVRLGQLAPVEAAPGKIEVLEFFWYSCPHCFSFEPVLTEWVARLPKDVAFKRVPIAFQSSYVPQQQMYFALEAMGLLAQLHNRFFAAIHVERQNLAKAEAIADWVVKQGVDRARFMEQFGSFSVSSKAARARQIMDAYQIEGVPALGVAGRFFTDGAMAKSMDGALRVVDYLIAEVRARR